MNCNSLSGRKTESGTLRAARGWVWLRHHLPIFLSAIFLSSSPAADLLVLMHGSGKLERYDAEGKHLGTVISGLPAPNALEGPDGLLYAVSRTPASNSETRT